MPPFAHSTEILGYPLTPRVPGDIGGSAAEP
jgi:hypothetical protein